LTLSCGTSIVAREVILTEWLQRGNIRTRRGEGGSVRGTAYVTNKNKKIRANWLVAVGALLGARGRVRLLLVQLR